MAHMVKLLHSFQAASMALGLSIALMAAGGCASSKAGMKAPELPARHWLDDAPGIPIENKDKYDRAVPSLYEPGKKFDFEDTVYLTIQQSPSLVNSAVNIEVKRLAQTSAAWKYLPEPHMTLRVSQNITQMNKGRADNGQDYGKTQYEIGFYAPFPNPVATYYEHKAQGLMTGIAISTHRKAVAEAIYRIGEAYLRIQARQFSLRAQKSLVPVAHELADYWRQVERVEGSQGAQLSLAQQHEREMQLAVEKATMEETIERTQLKVMAGVDPNQSFTVDASHADDIVKGFDGMRLRWEDKWNDSEDNIILHTQLKLHDFNILLQWAQYVPNMSLGIDMNPPRGQSNPADGNPDHFVHFTFDFPLIDWGRRYRDVQTARMGKAQAFHALADKRNEFQNKWLQAEQAAQLALTNMKLAQSQYKTAQMQYEEARIGFENGLEQLPVVAGRQEAMVQAEISYINQELQYRLAKLKWMYNAGVLQERFLGLPAMEVLKQDRRARRGVSGNEALGIEDRSRKAAQPEEDPSKPVFEPAPAPSPAKAEAKPAPAGRSKARPAAAAPRAQARPIGHAKVARLPELPDEAGAASPAPAPSGRPIGKPARELQDMQINPTL